MHVSNLRENFTISYIGGQVIDEDQKVEYLRASVSGHALIDSALSQYTFTNPDDAMHTFEGIVTYIEDHLPNLQTAAQLSSHATANIMASEAYLTLEAENKTLKEKQTKHDQDQINRKRCKGGKGKGKNKKNKKGNRDKGNKGTASGNKAVKYCYAHGTQHTHTSQECKVMAGDKERFNAAMRSSKDPNNPPGGSTRALGQKEE